MDIDDDEALLLLVGVVGALLSLFWQWQSWSDIPLGRSLRTRRPVLIVNALCVALLVVPALLLWSDPEVKASPVYLTLLTSHGFVWLWISQKLMSFIGLSYSLDVEDRDNMAASAALVGGLIGVTFIYCGSNVGEGPSLWNNVFSVTVGTLGFMLVWAIFEAGMGLCRAVTEGRDMTSGVRLGGFLIALGLICGRAVAGNWDSAFSTVADFVKDGWWAIVLVLVATVLEPVCRPRPTQPFPDRFLYGYLPATVYCLLAAGWVWHLGWWEGAL